ncbi:MAG: carboxypeptidase regulatory-like domain-containing protein [Pyrinomonadaceae bacterium]|nr:carboxypeptidase regulatory-like domain-containing protein [Pyrinomonadaceae bacterium]
MGSTIKNIKLGVFTLFTIGFAVVFTNSTFFKAEASINGAPSAHTGAPGESTCTVCHNAGTNTGVFNVVAPSGYVPGQTYTIQVQHTTNDTSRAAWGFELIPLTSANAMAGTVANLNTNTRVRVSGAKSYVTHTTAGTFAGQTLSANWSFRWTAPATNIGNVTFYATGLQADNDGNDGSGDQTYVRSVVIPPITTASLVEISGRVLTPEGRGLTNARVTITGPNGVRLTTLTTRFGSFRLVDVEVGASYVIDVSSRRYHFDSRVVQVMDNMTDIDFIGQYWNVRQ